MRARWCAPASPRAAAVPRDLWYVDRTQSVSHRESEQHRYRDGTELAVCGTARAGKFGVSEENVMFHAVEKDHVRRTDLLYRHCFPSQHCVTCPRPDNILCGESTDKRSITATTLSITPRRFTIKEATWSCVPYNATSDAALCATSNGGSRACVCKHSDVGDQLRLHSVRGVELLVHATAVGHRVQRL